MSQGNISENIQRNFKRFSLSNWKHQEAKTITCITGSIFDVIIDLRKFSNIS